MPRKKNEISNEEIIRLHDEEGWSCKKISEHFGMSDAFVYQRFRRIGKKRRSTGFYNSKRKEENPESTRRISADVRTKCIEMYNAGSKIIEIANTLGISRSSVQRTVSSEGSIRPPVIDDETEKKCVEMYLDGFTISDIMLELSISKSSVSRIAKRNGVKSPKRVTEEESQRIVSMYDDGKTALEISIIVGRADGIVGNIVREAGILREYKRENRSNWMGGITPIRNAIRKSNQKIQWRDSVFARDDYKSVISRTVGELNCHHKIPFKVIFNTLRAKYSVVNEDLLKDCMINDERMFDKSNGMTLTKDEHRIVEDTPIEAHPLWRLSKVPMSHSAEIMKDFNPDIFNDYGKMEHLNNEVVLHESANREIKDIVRYQHYIGTIPPSQLVLSAFVGNIIVGVSAFGAGANKNIGKDTWELRRLCIPYWTEKDFASRFLSMCCKYIKARHKSIRRLVSFADPSVGHGGGVYRASSWEEQGETKSSYCYFDPHTFSVLHKSCCRRIKGVDKTERTLARERDLVRVSLPPKIRFVKSLRK